MSVIDTLRGRAGNKSPSVPQANDIALKLTAAEEELASLEAQHGSAALDALSGAADAEAELASLSVKLASARERVATLRAAHRAAVERDEAARRAQLAALQRTQLTAMRKHLEARDAAAVALTAALEEAARQFHTLLDRSAKAEAACPKAMQFPAGNVCGRDELRTLVANEMFKLSASPGDQDGHSLPGSQTPHVDFVWQPSAVPALVEKLNVASAYVLAKFKGAD